jgi:hypothetical protein
MSANQRLRASLVVLLGVIMAVAGFAAPATAAPYSHHATTSVSNSHPAAGSTITFCGAGFLAGEKVTITLDRTRYPSVTADKSGAWCTRIALSSRLRSGSHTLTATGTTSHRSSSTKIHVEARHHGDSRHHGNTRVLGESAVAGTSSNSAIPVNVAGVSADAAGTTGGSLAFAGTNAIGVGAFGALLLLSGATMMLVGRRRKVNS